MAEISVGFRNNVCARKCAVSSPRIISLEIGDESTGDASESALNGYFLNGQASSNDVGNKRNAICKWDKNFLIHSQSSLSTYDERPSDKIKSTDNNDFDLCDLLNSIKLADVSENTNSKKNTTDDKMKIKSNIEKIGSLSDLLSSCVYDTPGKNDINTKINYCGRNNTQDCGIDLLDFDFSKNESSKDSLSSNNSSLKVEGNLSDLLSSINVGESDSSNFKKFNTNTMCNSKDINKLKMENEPCVANLSDLLSSIDLGNSNDSSCNQIGIKIAETENESCLADLLQSVNIHKSDKPAMTLLNNKPSSFGSTNMFPKGTNGISDSLNDFASDVSCSSSNSCSSSFSEREDNSLTKNKLADKVFECDSSYGSADSGQKGFSFFNYSSDDQFSFNTLLNNKSDVIKTEHECKNVNEEMSMADLLTIVSPDFKNPVLSTLNEMEKHDSSLNENESSMLDLMESLNIGSKNFGCDDSSKELGQSDEKLMGHDCVDGRISKKVQSGETINNLGDGCLENYLWSSGSDVVSEGSQITNGDDETGFIDLRECIKSAKHKFIPNSPIKPVQRENQSLEHVSPTKIQFHTEEKPLNLPQNSSNPFEFNNRIPEKKLKINLKQTMFSKALACKPKRDQSLLQKVTNIKNELLSNILNRPNFIDRNVPPPIIESVVQSDKCILSNVGLRSFGLGLDVVSCEMQ